VCIIASIAKKQFRVAVAASVATFSYSESIQFSKLIAHANTPPLINVGPQQIAQRATWQKPRALAIALAM
jgi:hypothetical protein